MNIVAADGRRVKWQMPVRGAARGGGWSEREALVIGVRSEDGATGLGEAAPLPGMSVDSLADAERALADLRARLPIAVAAPGAVAREIADEPAARFAVETAFAVAFAQRARRGVAHLYGARGDAPLAVSAVVDDEADARASDARVLKVKLGDAPIADDLARLRRIARAAPGKRMRVDVNGKWRLADAPAHLAALADVLAGSLEYVEEPCQRAHELLAQPLACKLALDESLATIGADVLARALRSPQLAALVLKPTLLGGFARCLELATVARAHGVAPVVTHALESPVGRAACRELARAVGGDVAHGVGA